MSSWSLTSSDTVRYSVKSHRKWRAFSVKIRRVFPSIRARTRDASGLRVNPLRQSASQRLLELVSTWTLCLSWLRPAEATLFQPFAQHPQTCPIKIKHFDPGMSPVTKDVERSAARVLSKTAAHQPVQTVEALAHVAAVDQQKDLQAPTEADHRFAPSRPSNSAANAASVALLI